ncbi:MAG: hypothetical protein ACLFQS_06490 [Bacteroidales bacterium]
MTTDNAIKIQKLIDSILNFNYPMSEYADDYLENINIYLKLTKDTLMLKPHPERYMEQNCFDVALKTITSDLLLGDLHSFADNLVVQSELSTNLENLSTSDLSMLSDYLRLISNIKWSDEEEYFIRTKNSIEETFDFATVANLIELHVLELINRYLFQQKPFFLYGKDEKYRLDLHGINKKDFSNNEDYEYEKTE